MGDWGRMRGTKFPKSLCLIIDEMNRTDLMVLTNKTQVSTMDSQIKRT